jgi:hypothetical protein
VESTGRVPFIGSQTIEKKVRVVLARDIEPLFDIGLFGDEGFDMHGNGYTDSYNSENGAYGGLNAGSYGDVGTNATITSSVQLYNNIEINGYAITGWQSIVDWVVDLFNRATITSGMDTLSEPKDLPAYFPPTDLSFMDAFYGPSNSPEVVITESGEYSSFTMGSNTTVTINGDVTLYINGNFLMDSKSNLNIADGSEVEIVLGDGIFMQSSNSYINNLSQDPKNLAIFGTPDFKSMTWRSNGQFYGSVYIPSAFVDYNSNFDFFGSMICNYLSLYSQAGLHYDESLGKWDKYGKEGDTYSVQSWQEIR